MIIATKTPPAATDISKEPPLSINNENEPCDHKEHGRTICVWNLSVLPVYKGGGLGKTLMKSYQRWMKTSGIADRVALTGHPGPGGPRAGGFEWKGKSEMSGKSWEAVAVTSL